MATIAPPPVPRTLRPCAATNPNRRRSRRRHRSILKSSGWRRKCAVEALESRRLLAVLQNGDANQDLWFDESDFVQVFKAGKYENGEPATWSEGDWNGAPGGSVGNPPVGDGEFDSRDLVDAFVTGLFKLGPYDAEAGDPVHTRSPLTTDLAAEVSLEYDFATGGVSLVAPRNLTTFHLHSDAGRFIRENRPDDAIRGLFDVYDATDLFLLRVGDVLTSVDFGPILPPGLDGRTILTDLTVDGSFESGGGLGSVRLDCECLLRGFVAPLGSGASTGELLEGELTSDAPVQDFEIETAIGEHLSLLLTPSPGLAASVSVLASDGTLIESASTEGSNPAVLDQVDTASGGFFTVRVSANDNSTGSFQVQPVYNSLHERETISGRANNTVDTAESIDGTFLAAPFQMQTSAVLGELEADDWYTMTPQAGEYLSVVVDSVSQAAAPIVELAAEDGTKLAAGEVAPNAKSVINNYLSDGSPLKILVSGAAQSYTLFTIRNGQFEIEPNDTTDLAQPISITGNVVGYAMPSAEDWHGYIGALDVAHVSAFNAAGSPIPVVLSSAGLEDERSELASIQISRAGALNAQYFLHLEDSVPDDVGILTIPRNGGSTAKATEFVIDSLYPLRPETVAPADLVVDGVAATAVSVEGGLAVFQIPELNEGPHTATIAAGRLTDVTGRANAAVDVTFEVDVTPPAVASTNPVPEGVAAAGIHTVEIQFSENVFVNDLSQVSLVSGSGDSLPSLGFTYDADRLTLALQYDLSLEDQYTLRIDAAGPNFLDEAGLPLDGDADGSAEGDFVLTFFTDIDRRTISGPLQQVGPRGSAAYQARGATGIIGTDDTDSFVIALDANQVISASVVGSQGLVPSVTLVGPNNQPLATSTTFETHHSLAARADEAGDYLVEITGKNGTTGRFVADIGVNLIFEDENSDNGQLETALQLDDLTTRLGSGDVAQITVQGQLITGPTRTVVVEGFLDANLPDNWSTTSSDPNGRVRVSNEFTVADGDFALVMDTGPAPLAARTPATLVYYDPFTGEVSFDTLKPMTTLELKSASGIFTGSPAQNLGHQFDLDKDDKVFKVVPDGFDDLSFGNVAQPGLTYDFLSQDLSIDGSYVGGGRPDFSLIVIEQGVRSEAIWSVDLARVVKPTLEFWHASWNDPPTALPVSFENSIQGDGVSLSVDGSNWYRVFTPRHPTDPGTWVRESIDLTALAQFADVPLDGPVQIKFQHYGNGALPDQGRGYDRLRILDDGPDQDWYAIDLLDGQTASFSARNESADELTISLLDSAGNRLIEATSSEQATISNFEDSTDGGAAERYAIRVINSTSDPSNYELVVTKNAGFEHLPSPFPGTNETPVGLGLNLVYDPNTGQIDLITDTPLRTLELFSPEGVFVGAAADFPGDGQPSYYRGVFDLYNKNRVFLLDPEGFAEDGLANLANAGPGLTLDDLNSEIRIGGSIVQMPGPCCGLDDLPGGFRFVLAGSLGGSASALDLTTAGAYVGYLDAVGLDSYQIELGAGSELTLETATPASGPLLFENRLDPSLELIDPQGNVVATDDNSGDDGRNARLTYVAAEAAIFTVDVGGNGTVGEYLVSASGSFPMPGLKALQTFPQDGSVLTEGPEEFRVRFNRLLDPDSVQAGDLLIDGVAATEVEIIDPQTVSFTVADSIDQGSALLQIPAGAISDLAGRTSDEVSVSFSIDTIPPSVTAVSLEQDAVLPAGSLSVDVSFSEAINLDALGEDGIPISGFNGTIVPTTQTYDAQTSTLTLTYDNVPEGRYDLDIRGSVGNRAGVRDLAGNPLAANVSRSFIMLAESEPYTGGFTPVAPWETFAFESQLIESSFGFSGDLDTVTFDVSANQLINVYTIDRFGRHQATLLGPDGQVLSSRFSTRDSTSVFAVGSEAGTYSVILESTAGRTRNYEMRILLNQVAEAEGSRSTSNNLPSSAIQLDNLLRGEDIQFVTVHGEIRRDVDYYSVNVPHRGRISLGVESADPALQVILLDDQLNVVASGFSGSNFDLAVDSFQDKGVDGLPSNYFIQVRSTSSTSRPYWLNVNRGIGLEAATGTTPLGPSLSAVGSIAAGGNADEYTFLADAGSVINASFAIPYVGNDVPTYSLSASLRLLDPSGQEVAAGDNQLSHTAAAAGIYRVQVVAESGEGGYSLSIAGAGLRPENARVLSVNPVAGTELFGLPGEVILEFSHTLDPSSVDVADVLIGGQPAARVTRRMPHVFGFVPALGADVGNGEYTVELRADSVTTLAGVSNEAFQANFSIDRSTTDFDGDGDVDGEDLNTLCLSVGRHGLTYDFNQDQQASRDDFHAILREIFGTLPGDINLDGAFNSSDLVDLLQAGKFESGEHDTVWSDGDFNCDGEVLTSDLVEAFKFGAYEGGAAATPKRFGGAKSLASEDIGMTRRDLDFAKPERPVYSAAPPSTSTSPVARAKHLDLAPWQQLDTKRIDAAVRELSEAESDKARWSLRLGEDERPGALIP